MPKTIDEIFAEYFAQQDAIRAEYDASAARRKAAWAEHIARLHTCGHPPPAVIDGWYTPEQYAADAARGWSTE